MEKMEKTRFQSQFTKLYQIYQGYPRGYQLTSKPRHK